MLYYFKFISAEFRMDGGSGSCGCCYFCFWGFLLMPFTFATASTAQHSFVVCWHESFIDKTAKPTAKVACEPSRMCINIRLVVRVCTKGSIACERFSFSCCYFSSYSTVTFCFFSVHRSLTASPYQFKPSRN